jgi:maleate isomerase
LSILTPYVAEVTERGRHFFEQSGFSVSNAVGMGISEDHEIGNVSPEQVYRFVRENVDAGADGVFISCTNLRTVGIIAALEQDLGLPVVSAVQASFWDCLRIAGIRDHVDGFGRLFAQ